MIAKEYHNKLGTGPHEDHTASLQSLQMVGFQKVICPYCAEEINDRATLCRHCKQDLRMIQPLMGRIADLEQRIVTLQQDLHTLANSRGQMLADPAGHSVGHKDAILLPTIIVVLTIAAMFLFDRYTRNSPDRYMIFLFASIPLPAGLWLGFARRHWSPRSYFLLGTVAAFGTLFVILAYSHTMPRVKDLPMEALFLIGPILVFGSAALLGQWGVDRLRQDRTGPGVSRSMAEKWAPTASPQRDQIVNRMAAILSALGPLLALLGSLITGYFSYLGAIAAAAKP